MNSKRDRVEALQGNIVDMNVDAIVNAANNMLQGGAGVDGAIHKAAGRELLAECLALGGCRTGEAAITSGYNLKAKWVIHTVGPVWRGGKRGEDEKLAMCYRNCLRLAAERALETIAFPAISTGTFGYPVDRAAMIALHETLRFVSMNEAVRKIFFVCLDPTTFETYSRDIDRLFGQ